MARRWQPGDAITLRYVGHLDGHVRDKPGLLQALPHIVVEDGDEALVLYMPAGARRHYVDLADRSRVVPDELWRADCVRIMPAGKPYSVMLFWKVASSIVTEPASTEILDKNQEIRERVLGSSAPPTVAERAPEWAGQTLWEERIRRPEQSAVQERTFAGWYVNLEAPFVRTPIGVDTTDNSLDVVVAPDRSWRWKDGNLTQFWIDAGAYTETETAQLFEDGRDAVALLEAGAFPFDGSYLDWRPEAHWGVPDVHADWPTLEGYDLTLTTGRRLPWTDPPR